jgi:asparagine synthetase B (glutamine-hydrolysing)
MARSVEMRVPFLDHRLVECLARVHPSEKFKGGWTKGIFRDAVVDLLPTEIRFRRDKNGFGVPEDAWVRGVFSPRFLEIFRGTTRAGELGFISEPALRSAYTKFLAGRGFLDSRHFFRAYAFEMFLRRYEGWLHGNGADNSKNETTDDAAVATPLGNFTVPYSGSAASPHLGRAWNTPR